MIAFWDQTSISLKKYRITPPSSTFILLLDFSRSGVEIGKHAVLECVTSDGVIRVLLSEPLSKIKLLKLFKFKAIY